MPSDPAQARTEAGETKAERLEVEESTQFEYMKWDTEYYVKRSIRYHSSRTNHFGRLGMTSSTVGVMFGSVTIMAVILQANPLLAIGAAATATIFSTFNLIFGSSRKVALHDDLRRRYIKLENRLLDVNHISELATIRKDIRRIEMDERPVLQAMRE